MPKWVEVLKSVGPGVVAAFVPGGAIIAPFIIAGIEHAEGIPGKTGAEKKASVVNLSLDTADAINAVRVKHGLPPILDRANLATAVGSAIDTTIAVTNLKVKPSA